NKIIIFSFFCQFCIALLIFLYYSLNIRIYIYFKGVVKIMFILTKNKIENNKIQEIQKTLISKKTVSLKDSLIINNPKHLTLMTNFSISDYNHIYEVNDYIIKENENLFTYIKNKDFEYILKTLTNTHEDNVYAKEI